jgi:hypothetical protein
MMGVGAGRGRGRQIRPCCLKKERKDGRLCTQALYTHLFRLLDPSIDISNPSFNPFRSFRRDLSPTVGRGREPQPT